MKHKKAKGREAPEKALEENPDVNTANIRQALRDCQYCGKPVPVKARICANCQSHLRGTAKYLHITKEILALLAFAAAIISIWQAQRTVDSLKRSVDLQTEAINMQRAEARPIINFANPRTIVAPGHGGIDFFHDDTIQCVTGAMIKSISVETELNIVNFANSYSRVLTNKAPTAYDLVSGDRVPLGIVFQGLPKELFSEDKMKLVLSYKVYLEWEGYESKSFLSLTFLGTFNKSQNMISYQRIPFIQRQLTP